MKKLTRGRVVPIISAPGTSCAIQCGLEEGGGGRESVSAGCFSPCDHQGESQREDSYFPHDQPTGQRSISRKARLSRKAHCLQIRIGKDRRAGRYLEDVTHIEQIWNP
jgi:hypothetical protein